MQVVDSVNDLTQTDDMPNPDVAQVQAVRHFSRAYTQALGVLEEGLLRTPYSLTESRVLFELGQQRQTDTADLRRALGLDAGYLSRILARFEADGLVVRRRSDADGRRQTVALTEHGGDVVRDLDDRSSTQVRTLLARLEPDARSRLVSGMDDVRTLLGDDVPPSARTVRLRRPEPGDHGWVVARHGRLYAEEYGWDVEFEGLVARIVADFVTGHDPRRERAWIAEVDGRRAGSVFCVADDPTTARLRLLLVSPFARGCGVGGRLVDECVRFARAAGYDRMTLWTNDVLTAARRRYEAVGFRLDREHPHHSYGVDLVGQDWSMTL